MSEQHTPWTIYYSASIGAGTAWLMSHIIDEPPPLFWPLASFGLAFVFLTIAVRKREI